MSRAKLIALFPEASFGAALNCVGIAQALERQGARPVFICHEGFKGVFSDYGFQEYHLESAGSLTDAERDEFWQAFIARHLPHFRLSPKEQLSTYVAPTWDAIVDTAKHAEQPLQRILDSLRPDAVVLDNVVMFPAIRNSGLPWARVVSCAETEIPDPAVPPYLSGCPTDDKACHHDFAAAYAQAVASSHERFNRFLAAHGMSPYPPGQFLETSPWLNLLLSPDIVRRRRKYPLDPERFVFLNGCVREEAPSLLPGFPRNEDSPLVYVSFGSLGAMDVQLFRDLIAAFSDMPYRFLVNVGANRDAYETVPDNVYIDSWFVQPSVVSQCDLFIHHGGNNSLGEALYYGVPSLIMPYCWDGHDNACRVGETGTGRALPRYGWSRAALQETIGGLIHDAALRRRLADNARAMQAFNGTAVAAKAILSLTERSRS